MKAFTDLEQSKKLAEILPFESADIILTLGGNSELTSHPIMRNYSEFYNYLRTFELEEKYIKCTYIPAWSLAALLNIIKPINDNTYTLIGTLDGGAMISFDKVTNVMFQEKEIIDAVFEMVVWLKENKKL
jgi:hypothetical protein